MKLKTTFVLLLIMSTLLTGQVFAKEYKNTKALSGLKEVGVIFDVTVAKPERLLLRLKLIEETVEGIEKEGVKVKAVVLFRGGASMYMTNNTQLPIKKKIQDQVRKLSELGYTLEQCAIALRIMGVDPETIIPELTIVGNVYTSIIGYESKNYSLVDMD